MTLNAITPTDTAYQRVNILIMITSVKAIETSIFCKMKNPAKLPSTTPIPRGRNDIAPKIIDTAYIDTTLSRSRCDILNDKITK